jgi:hypothetical protein
LGIPLRLLRVPRSFLHSLWLEPPTGVSERFKPQVQYADRSLNGQTTTKERHTMKTQLIENQAARGDDSFYPHNPTPRLSETDDVCATEKIIAEH